MDILGCDDASSSPLTVVTRAFGVWLPAPQDLDSPVMVEYRARKELAAGWVRGPTRETAASIVWVSAGNASALPATVTRRGWTGEEDPARVMNFDKSPDPRH